MDRSEFWIFTDTALKNCKVKNSGLMYTVTQQSCDHANMYLLGVCVCEVGKTPVGEILGRLYCRLVLCDRVPRQVETHLDITYNISQFI